MEGYAAAITIDTGDRLVDVLVTPDRYLVPKDAQGSWLLHSSAGAALDAIDSLNATLPIVSHRVYLANYQEVP